METMDAAYRWPELIRGKLIRRYKRFLADIELEDKTIVTAHCANTGTMKECSEPGRPVYISCSNNPKRKLKYSWELIEMPTSLVGVNTLIPNRLVKLSIEKKMVKELRGYHKIRSEVNTGNGSRLDLMLEKETGEICHVEIKNCTLVAGGRASFPDAVTTRGQKHLDELKKLKAQGDRTVIFFLIQRMDATEFSPADHIDPVYGEKLRDALNKGVEVLVYDVKIDLNMISLRKAVPVNLGIYAG